MTEWTRKVRNTYIFSIDRNIMVGFEFSAIGTIRREDISSKEVNALHFVQLVKKLNKREAFVWEISGI